MSMSMQQIPWLGWRHEYFCHHGQPQLAKRNEDFINMWNPYYEQLQPGEAWDSGTGAAPALTDLLASGTCEVAGKRVLIPGCGRGYDVAVFAQHGAQAAVGLEVAPAAVGAAQSYLKDTLTPEESARAAVELGDFFRWSPETPFDIGYDYTFFCALPPALRSAVAHSWARMIREGGLLITLIFPVNGKDTHTGPPFPVSPELYKDEFTAAGFKLKSLEAVAPHCSHPGRGGMEFMATWGAGVPMLRAPVVCKGISEPHRPRSL